MCRILAPTLVAFLLMAATPARADVWVEASTAKIQPGRPSSGVSEVRLAALRNEFVAFQVVVAAGSEPYSKVDAALSDLVGPSGATIPGTSAELYREYFVDLTQFNSSCEVMMNTDCASHPEYLRTPGWYPDPLIPFRDPYGADPTRPVGAPFDVPANSLQVIFADLKVPGGIAAGDYRGTFTVSRENGPPVAMPVSLQVLDADLPSQRTVVTAFNFSVSALPEYHGGPDGGDAANRDRIFRNYELEAHRHRVDFSRPGPRISFTFGPDGHLVPPDYTEYDAYWEPRVNGSRYPDGAGVRKWDLGMFKPGGGNLGMTDAQYAEAASNLADHLRQKGFLEHVYLYGTDEPWMPERRLDGSYERIQADVERLRTGTTAFDDKILITGPWQTELDPYVGIWCPDTAMYDDDFWPAGTWAGRDKYKELRDAGRELWVYVCNQNFPALMGYDVDSPVGHEPRLLKWGAWYEGAKGFLYWRMTYWQSPDPWNVLSEPAKFGADLARNGDGILVYPGDHDGTLGQDPPPPWPPIDGPVTSLRLKQIRDGLEDWELFLMATTLGGEAYARAQVGRVYRRFGAPLDEYFDPANRPWSLDDREMLDARQQVALKVQFLLHPESYEDPEVPVRPDVAEDAATVPDDAGPADLPADVPGPDAALVDVPTVDVPTADLPAADAPATEPPLPDAPTADLPATELSVPDAPTADVPATELPVPDAPTPDVPTADIPNADLPAAELPAPDAPTPDAPSTDLPAVDTPTGDVPGTPDVPDAAEPAPEPGTGSSGGCAASPSSPAFPALPFLLLIGIALAALRRRPT